MRIQKIFVGLMFLLVTLLLGQSAALADVGPYADWWAEYYNNPHLHGQPVAVVPEAEIDNDWGYLSPRHGIPSDYFSVRWSANIEFEGGFYTFLATVDDGVRLWIDGHLLIDEWREQSITTFTGRTYIKPGIHHVQMAYYEATGEASARLTWRLDSTDPHDPRFWPPHPGSSATITIDNTDAGFIWGGPVVYRNVAGGGQGHNYYWTYNTTTQPVNFGKWTPHFSGAGTYEVFVYIPHHYATSTNVRYRILHNGHRADTIVNQNHYSDQWVSIGTYYFNGHNDGHEFIAVYDNTREGFASRYVAFDAIKLERR
jgi:hypothetical protein